MVSWERPCGQALILTGRPGAAEGEQVGINAFAVSKEHKMRLRVKYAYSFWRPITAVRNGDQHGNPAVERDAGWLPLVDAPIHPEYPCAHGISSAAVAKVLQTELGDDVPLSMTSPFLPGVTRKWVRISDYAKEVSNARIWSRRALPQLRRRGRANGKRHRHVCHRQLPEAAALRPPAPALVG
ncbi:MAG: hypothetical protein ABIU58_06970 [Ramlibacter sp.]